MWDRSEDVPAEVERFMTTIQAEQDAFDRYLATVLFTDIVGSTAIASAGGDAAWQDLVEHHHRIVRGALARFRGTEMDTAGDGFFATFDGPARAVRCATGDRRRGSRASRSTSAQACTPVRCRRSTARPAASRSRSAPGSCRRRRRPRCSCLATVKDLVAGSGLTFEDAGEHELKGVPEPWHLYRVVD